MKYKKRKVQEMDGAKVDYYMELMEAAKRKAEQQKKEYGKYVTWKVKMQRKERKQREKESEIQRMRLESHLSRVMCEYKEQRRREARLWSQPLPKAVTSPQRDADASRPTVSSAPAVETRLHMGPLDAPPFTLVNSAKVKETVEHQDEVREMMKSNKTNTLNSARLKEDESSSYNKMREKITLEDIFKVPGIGFDGSIIGPPNLVNLTPAKLNEKMPPRKGWDGTKRRPQPPEDPNGGAFSRRLKDVPLHLYKPPERMTIQQSQKRHQKVENMFEKARRRRDYAMGKLLEDPPVDYHYDVTADLLRYMPAELLDDNDPYLNGFGNKKDSDFFITAVNEADIEAKKPRIGKKLYKLDTRSLLDIPITTRQRATAVPPLKKTDPEQLTPREMNQLDAKRHEILHDMHQYWDKVEAFTSANSKGAGYTWNKQTTHSLPSKDLAALQRHAELWASSEPPYLK